MCVQLEWLKDGLFESEAPFKIVVTAVPIAELSATVGVGARELWQAFDAQRSELLEFIRRERIPGIAFVSGERCCAVFSRADLTFHHRHRTCRIFCVDTCGYAAESVRQRHARGRRRRQFAR